VGGTFTYSNPRVIHWGRGSVSGLASLLEGLQARRLALISTRSVLADEGLTGIVRNAMGSAVVGLTAAVGQHAPLAQVHESVERAAGAGLDGVISFGGGSAIDAAKIFALQVAERQGEASRPLPHVAIPTTLSAAELAAGAGFTNEVGDKAGMRDPRLMASAVIYDADLTLATPLPLWLSTGIRAVDHAVEAILADGEHPFSDVMSLEALRRLFDSLPRAKVAPEDPEVRSSNQLAAWFSFTLPGESAGGLSHVMGKQIGARHDIPHGVTSCLLLPHVMRYLARSKPDRVAALAAATGPDPASRVEELIGSLGLPKHIAAYGIGEPELSRAASELAGRYPARDLLEIYLSAL